MSNRNQHSINAAAQRLTDLLVARSQELRVSVAQGSRGERLIDAGATTTGGIDAGVLLTEICLGGLGKVMITPDQATPEWPWRISVRSSQPVIACLGSQYAGWSLSHSEGDTSFFALGSGPARALACKEELFGEIGFRDQADCGTLVLEAAAPPPPPLVDSIAHDCHVRPENLTIIYAPTQSLAASVQIVGRVLEVAMHKAHTLAFPLHHIVDGMASAPLSPPHPDFITAMGRTNDAIIYGGQVHLYVSGPDEAARNLAEALPSRGSRDYGRPFAEIFQAVKGDFYAIDPLLFSPALAAVTAIESGRTFRSGALDQDLLRASFA